MKTISEALYTKDEIAKIVKERKEWFGEKIVEVIKDGQ